MSDKPNDGGPAFPLSFSTAEYHTGNVNVGMTLRDWLAGMAMQGDWASQPDGGGFGNSTTVEEFTPRVALYYRAADAMLKAREL